MFEKQIEEQIHPQVCPENTAGKMKTLLTCLLKAISEDLAAVLSNAL